jgi:hypothetical protein
LGAFGLVGKILFEAVMITFLARRRGVTLGQGEDPGLPKTVPGVWRFYWPLANSMVVIWGGRALMVGLIARAVDAELSLAAWPAAWGLVLLVANSTRMVQQVILRHRLTVRKNTLLRFAFSVGGACSLLLLLAAWPPWGQVFIDTFIGKDDALASLVRPVLLLCTPVPLLVALQNAAQAFLIGESRTRRVNGAAWMGTGTLLLVTGLGVASGSSGALVAASAMVVGLFVEIAWLVLGIRPASFSPRPKLAWN